MEEKGLVSVIIPYYNRKTVLLRAIESVVNQKYKNWELILINDGSSDGGEELVKRYISEHPQYKIKNINQENGGPSKARNTGMKVARGEFIAFLDSDDSWVENKLEVQVKFMEENPDIIIVGSNYNIISEVETKTRYLNTNGVEYANFYHLLYKVFFWVPTILIRREPLIRDNIFFMEGKHYAEDNLFLLQIIRKYNGARIMIPLVNTYKFQYGVEGLSANLRQLTKNDIDNFKILYNQNENNVKKINYLVYMSAIVFARIKHYKRLYSYRIYKKKIGECK